MAVRDRVVLWVLGVGAACALFAWQVLGPWPAMLVAVLAVAVASAAYRIERPRIDLDDPLGWLGDGSGRSAASERTEAVDQ